MNQALIDLGEQISAALPDQVRGVEVAYDELTVRVEACRGASCVT